MKIVCKSATQVYGYGVVSRGQHIEWPDGMEFPPQVLGNFVAADTGAALKNAPDPKLENAPTKEQVDAERKRAEKIAMDSLIEKTAKLGRKKLEAALDVAGVPHRANLSETELAKALLRSQGNEVD